MLKHENKHYKKVVLAYSGGLDTSTIVPWLKENYGDCEVICFVADVGQEREDLEGIEQKAKQSGASKCIVKDLREEFVKDYVFEAMKTGAIYEGEYLLGTAIARPVIAKAMVECALAEGADAIAHGATGKGNDQVRFESAVAALAPQLDVIAPWRIWDMQSREELLAYCEKHHVPCKATLKKIYSRDANCLHISTEGGELENTWNAPSENVWVWTTDPDSLCQQGEMMQQPTGNPFDQSTPQQQPQQQQQQPAQQEKKDSDGVAGWIKDMFGSN